MSYTSKEDRLKLKAKRFNKFEPSTSAPYKVKENTDSLSLPTSIKRIRSEESNEAFNSHKRICVSPNYSSNKSSPVSKNLANNRLKRLRETIQAESKPPDSHKAGLTTEKAIAIIPRRDNGINGEKHGRIQYVPENSNKYPSATSKRTDYDSSNNKFSVPKGKKSFEGTSTTQYIASRPENNILEESYTTTSQKNLANERLKSLKKSINSSNSDETSNKSKVKPEMPLSTCQDLQSWSGKINRENTVNKLKRKICSNTDTFDYDENTGGYSAVKKYSFDETHSSPLKALMNNDKEDQHIFIKKNGNPNGNIFSCGTPVSERLSKVKESSDLHKSIKSSTSNTVLSTPTSQRLPVEPNTSDTVLSTPISQRLSVVESKSKEHNNISNNLSSSKPKEKAIISHSTPVQTANDTSYMSRMAMTASWIQQHQDVSSIDSNSQSSTSLNVNIDNSSDRVQPLDDTEEMEWATAEPDDEIVQRSDIEDKSEKKHVETCYEKLKDICIVVDTNIFISGLSKIKDIISMKIPGDNIKPVLYIPWMVITELDFMKDSCSDSKLKKNILNSMKFINTALNEKNPRIIGQTLEEVDKQRRVGPSPDDKIISCCIQIMEKYETVILLSNDVNLKNKAMINNVTACSAHEILMKIMSKVTNNKKFRRIMHKMGMMCSSVICECAKEAYGTVWIKMHMLSCPPWSLVECLKRFQKYWDSVFREKLMKQFTKIMTDLLHLLQTNKYICDDSEEFVEFIKLSATLCIFLKDIEECRSFVENTLTEIKKIG